ncbi:MAG: hypothetical protein Q9187_002728 [Circinaria calcarea]
MAASILPKDSVPLPEGKNPALPDAFPRAAGQLMITSHPDRTLVSTHDAENRETCIPAGQPVADRGEEKGMVRHLERGAPGDAYLKAMVQRGPEDTERSRQKNRFYGEVFAYREPNTSARDRVARDSVVTAEVKTNVIVRNILVVSDEYSFITDLSNHLSQRYSRPISSIMVTLDHSACLLYGGSFDPAYILTISALPSQVQPTTNKRNIALIQSFFSESLNVPASRGVVRFNAIPEENLGTNGVTVLGAIEDQGKTPVKEPVLDNRDSKPRLRSRSRRRRDENSKESKDLLLRARSQSRTSEKDVTQPWIAPPMPAMPTQKSALDMKAEKVQKMGKRRSFLQMFGK